MIVPALSAHSGRIPQRRSNLAFRIGNVGEPRFRREIQLSSFVIVGFRERYSAGAALGRGLLRAGGQRGQRRSSALVSLLRPNKRASRWKLESFVPKEGNELTKGIFVGLSTIDVVYYVNIFPKKNSKAVAQSQSIYAGGPAANAAITYSSLGGESTLVAAVGRHSIASLIVEELEKYSVRLIDLNPDFDEVPAISAVSVNRAGERSVVSSNATRIDATRTEVDEAAFRDASIVLIDGHQMEICQAWARAAQERGIAVVLDGGSWKDGTHELLQYVSVALCSADFMPPGCSTEDDVLDYLRESGIRNIAISHGAGPIRFISPIASGNIPVPQVEVADTMGAGDILHGAFCFYASNGCPFANALRDSARIAANSCRFRGTREWIRHIPLINRNGPIIPGDTAVS